jgi:hypothetical protein
MRVRNGFNWLRIESSSCPCEHGMEFLAPQNGGEFVIVLLDFQEGLCFMKAVSLFVM